jgi:hypothetical protein
VAERLEFGLVKPRAAQATLESSDCTRRSHRRMALPLQHTREISRWRPIETNWSGVFRSIYAVRMTSIMGAVWVLMHWASLMTSVIASAGRIPVELVDRLVAYCIDCECKQEQSTDLWPEYDLPTRELRRARTILSASQLRAEGSIPFAPGSARASPGGWRFARCPSKVLTKVCLIHESTFKCNVAQ